MNVHPEGYCVNHLCKARPCAGSGSIRTLLIAMPDDGYSQALGVRPQALNPLFFPDALEDAKALIQGQLQFYKRQTLSSDWFAIFIEGYWGKLHAEDGKVHDVMLFVAVGIDLGEPSTSSGSGCSKAGSRGRSEFRSSKTWCPTGYIGCSSPSPTTSGACRR